MATNPTDGTSRSIVDRVRNIILTPKTEWPVIDAEPSTIRGIYMSYVVILAAIPAIASALGQILFPVRIFALVIRPSPVHVIAQAIIYYVLSLVMVYVIALIVDALAPSFGSVKDPVKAFKLVAYSWTAAWVAGILSIIPMLGLLVILAVFYGYYLLYLGLPVLMKTPADKAAVYTIVIVVAAFVAYLAIGAITTFAAAAVSPVAMPASTGGSISLG